MFIDEFNTSWNPRYLQKIVTQEGKREMKVEPERDKMELVRSMKCTLVPYCVNSIQVMPTLSL
jgi:hypothetical protein